MLTIEGLIAVLALCMTAFGLGYMMGNNDKTQKQPPSRDKVSGYCCKLINRANRLSVDPGGYLFAADALLFLFR